MLLVVDLDAELLLPDNAQNDMSVQAQFPYHFFASLDLFEGYRCPVGIWFCWSDVSVKQAGFLPTPPLVCVDLVVKRWMIAERAYLVILLVV